MSGPEPDAAPPLGGVLETGLYVDDLRDEFIAKATSLGIVVLLAGLFIGWFAYVISRAIDDGIDEAVHVADAVSQGDLTVAIRPQGKDEVATLMRSLAAMQSNLPVSYTHLTLPTKRIV